MIFQQKTTPQKVRDRVIIFDHERRTCEILPVEERNEERIIAGNKSIPLADLELTLSPQGRVYVLNAPTRIIQATENLARVEKNTIIRQIAQYTRKDEKQGINWMNVIMVVVMGIITIVAISGGNG